MQIRDLYVIQFNCACLTFAVTRFLVNFRQKHTWYLPELYLFEQVSCMKQSISENESEHLKNSIIIIIIIITDF